MKHYPRRINIKKLLEDKSFFLFGPRSTGKTTLIKEQLKKRAFYDLLNANTFVKLSKQPSLLEEENPKGSTVVIDEIQKLPALLDEVHRLIENNKFKFLLTGSSSRKLKRGGVNLLAGRAWWAELFPLTWAEIGKKNFQLLRYLNVGGLPQVYNSSNHQEELKSYANLYLHEEIQAEALTRNIGAFASFLDTVALSNGQEINYESFASDCGVPSRTLYSYMDILKDTLIAYTLSPYTKTKKRKAISREKIYMFDLGVVNYLCRRGKINYKSELFGKAFEHFIVNECRAYLSYTRKDIPLHYWRSTSQFEVDLILGNQVAIEIKSSELIADKHLKGLRALKEENLIEKYIVVSQDTKIRKTNDGIVIYPWESFLTDLWGNQIL